jgi:hypothetical protein
MQPGKKKKASSHTWWSIAIFYFPYRRLLLANTARTAGASSRRSPPSCSLNVWEGSWSAASADVVILEAVSSTLCTHTYIHNVLHLMSPLFREHRSCLCKADEHMNNKRRHVLSITHSHQQCAAHLSSRRICAGDSSFDVIWSSALSNLHPQEELGINKLWLVLEGR